MATPTNHFHVIDPQGIAHTRSTKRTYTHAVLIRRGRRAVDAYYAQIKPAGVSAGKSWDRTQNEAKGIFPQSEMWRGAAALEFFRTFAIQWIKDHPETREEAVANAEAEALERAQAYEAGDNWKVFLNAGWNGRLDLAQKLASQQNAEEVLILEAVPGKPAKGAKKEAAQRA